MTQRSMSEVSSNFSDFPNAGSPLCNLAVNLSSLDRQSLPPPRGETVPPDRIIPFDRNDADSAVRNKHSVSSVFSSPHSLLPLRDEERGNLEMDINIPRHRSQRGVKDMNSEKHTDKVNQEHQHHRENVQRFFRVITSLDVNASPSFTQCVQEESMGLQRRLSDNSSAFPAFPPQSPLLSNVFPRTPSAVASSNGPLPSIMVPGGGMELPPSTPAWNLVYTPTSRYSGTHSAAPLTPAEIREEVEVPNVAFTLLDYAMQRSKPYIPASSVKVQLIVFLGAVAVLPFLLVVFLFGMHYWATHRLITALGNSPVMVRVGGGTCGDDFYKLTQGKGGSMPKEAFILMIGILLAFVILVVGGIFFLCVVHWRYVFSPYLQVLDFIRAATPELSKIDALTPEQLEKAPKPLLSLYFWRNEKKQSVITQLADKVVILGNSLQELKRYVPYKERSIFGNIILNSQNREATVSVQISDKHSDSRSQRSRRFRDPSSGPASPREDGVSVTFSLTNPLVIDNTHHHRNNSTSNIALANLRRENLTINAGSPEMEESNIILESRNTAAEDVENSISPSRRRVVFTSRQISPNFAGSSNSAMTEMLDYGRSLRISTIKEQTFSESCETRSIVATDFGYSIQQVTFLVCRLFLPKIDLKSNDKEKQKTAAEIQEMSRRFLKVVLRVAKEENGVPCDVRLDSAIITFLTPSGPNSVNLVHPSSCAFRIVSELAMLELHWSNISSTPFVWGVAMHLSRFVIGLCTTGTRNITVLYSEEVKLAYRVAELCHVFNIPFLMFQSCYNVFRVCVVAVPVDVIRRDTPNGKVFNYLYSPKSFGDEEEVDKKRALYAPIMEAFGLMCERNFTEAFKKLEGLLDLDNSVSRLQLL
ncbi:hypothetical protein LSM04_009520 [Trypanosoma melophagium]|uniref:uncharacterized protein n=1 Tax=Trypanosoma melophagium TaxID=715481 RepID=UPI003519EC8C|nr:hypothetical protein LSM04_009520 [Trypanosoma melophagium]